MANFNQPNNIQAVLSNLQASQNLTGTNSGNMLEELKKKLFEMTKLWLWGVLFLIFFADQKNAT